MSPLIKISLYRELKLSYVVLAAVALYLIWIVIYRLCFHPLAKYPGPFLAKLTVAYAAYHAWKGDIHLDMWKCHVKYGDFVRYGPNRLNFNTATSLKTIYCLGRGFAKVKNYDVMIHQARNTLTMSDQDEHARRRRILSQGFSDASMRRQEAVILSHIKKFVSILRPRRDADGWSAAFNVSHWCNYLTFDIMSDVIFGAKYDLLGKPDCRYVVDSILASNVRVGVLLHAPTMSIARLDKLFFPHAIKGRNLFLKFVFQLVRDTMALDPATRMDVSAILSASKDPQTGEKLRKSEIIAESTTMIVAGTDTSATAVASTFFYLAHNASAYERACKEVRLAFASADSIRLGATLNSCTYLRACIDEAMRMSPPVGSALYRQVPREGANVDGQFLPGNAGLWAGTPIYSIHHNPTYFPNPFKYTPERWLAKEAASGDAAQLELAHAALNPFSAGTRSCIGKGMAFHELMLTMAHVLWQLDFTLAAENLGGGKRGAPVGRDRPEEFQLYDHVTSAKNGPLIHFRKRQF